MDTSPTMAMMQEVVKIIAEFNKRLERIEDELFEMTEEEKQEHDEYLAAKAGDKERVAQILRLIKD